MGFLKLGDQVLHGTHTPPHFVFLVLAPENSADMAYGVRGLLGLDKMYTKGSFAIESMQVKHVSADRDADGDTGLSRIVRRVQRWEPATTLEGSPAEGYCSVVHKAEEPCLSE